MTIIDIALEPECREKISVEELARYIIRLVKEVSELPPGDSFFTSSPFIIQEGIMFFREIELCDALCREFDGRHPKGVPAKVFASFAPRYYEAMSLLKRQGLLIEYRNSGEIILTSVGEKSEFDDGILILIDNAQEIVNFLHEQAPNIDSVVEQYYLHSLRACQEGLYIPSVICLGAASERAIDCLREAIINHSPQYKNSLRNKYTADLLKHILRDFKNIFGQVLSGQLQRDLRDQLEMTEGIYRLNRNDAGHPKSVPMDITRCEQENYLNSFRRYAITIFKVIEILEAGVKDAANG